MAIVINGSGTVTGLAVGGLPDGSVDSDTLASGIDKTSISDSGDATAITIDSSENVGIGTGSPTSPLHILASSAGQTVAKFESNQAGAVAVEVDTDADRDSFLRFQEAGTTRWDLYFQGSSGGDELNIRNQSGTNIVQFKQDGRGKSQFTAMAWANVGLDNVAAGNSSLGGSLNVSSVTLNSTGNAKFNFTNNISSTAVATLVNNNTAGGTAIVNHTYTNGADVTTYHSNGNATNASLCNFTTHGGS